MERDIGRESPIRMQEDVATDLTDKEVDKTGNNVPLHQAANTVMTLNLRLNPYF